MELLEKRGKMERGKFLQFNFEQILIPACVACFSAYFSGNDEKCLEQSDTSLTRALLTPT